MTGFAEFPDLRFATSTRADGNMAFDWGERAEVEANRIRFLEKAGVDPRAVAFMSLEHTDTLQAVGRADRGKAFTADALMTNEPGVALFLHTADCLPAAFYDPTRHAIALAHLSWRSLDLGLAGKTLRCLIERYDSDPADIRVSIGPSIRKQSYVFDEVSQKDDARWRPHVSRTSDGKYSVDLAGFAAAEMRGIGVRNEHIEVSPMDTASAPDHFSHYRAVRNGEPEGRMATVLALA